MSISLAVPWLAAAVLSATVAAPPVKSVEDLPKLLNEELDLLEALDELDKDRADQDRLLGQSQKQREELIARRDEAQRHHDQSKNKLELERQRIQKRIRVLVETRRQGDLSHFMSSKDYASWLHKRHLLARLVKDDEKRIMIYHGTVKQFKDSVDDLDKKIQELEACEQRIKDAQSTLVRDKAIKQALLESVRTDKAFYAKADKDLGKAAKLLQDQITAFEEWTGKRLWFRDLKGQYLYPMKGGRIEQRFGNHTHPKFGTVTFHRGIDLVPGKGGEKNVRVIYTGRVVYAGWLKGYGNTVIVDHTQQDYTLYAHLRSVDVTVGEVLKSRQHLGVAGDTGPLERDSLYFEIRINGEPVDPAPWFR